MPSDMRLQCPSEDTPPSTRPPSVASSGASTSGTPHRSTSMDSLHTNSSTSEKPSGEEYIPTRLIRPTPKVNTNAMQFVKTGPAMLHKSAKEQMKKVEIVKTLRKTSLQEEEDWQSNSSSTNLTSFDEGSDWQSNLDKWKSSRRKRNEDVLERVIEVKKNELDEEFSKARRKSKTFSEMREEKSKRGRRYNLVVHDDDNNDLADLGLSTSKNGQSLSDGHEEGEAKSDAGFCTGSDTGSDGVFAEDNISDTSSALGDKREIHDSLLDSGSPPTSKKDSTIINGHENGHRVSENTSTTVKSTSTASTTVINSEYTYDKAIEEYKQFAENSAKKRTSSVTSLSSNASGSKEEHDKSLSSKRVEEKFSFYDGDVKEPRIIRREKNTAKIDIDKRRSMFELRNIDQQEPRKTLDYRKSLDVSSSLKSKVASFESINDSDNRTKSVKPLRDTKFKEKLASFNKKNSSENNLLTQRKTPERDQNFYQKLHSFTQMESKTVSENPNSHNSSRKSSPDRKHLWKSSDKLSSSFSSERAYEKGASPTTTTPLKDRIASYENLTPDHSRSKRELSVSMENLNETKPQPLLGCRTLQTSQSVSDLSRRTPFTTHYMVVEVDEEAEEKSCVKRNISRVSQTGEQETSSERSKNVSKRLTIYEEIEKVVIQRDVSKAPIYSIFNEDFEVKTPLLEKKLDSAADERRPPPLPEKTKSRLSSSEEPSSGLSDTVSRTSRTLPETPKESSHFRSPKLPADGSKSPRKLPQIPVDSQRPEEQLTSKNGNESSFLVPDVIPINEDKPLLNWPLQTSSETPLEPPPHTVPEVAPPPVPPPRVPSMEDPYTSSTSFITDEESKGIPYCDEDIDEVIDNESLPPVRKSEESSSDNFKDTSLDRNIKNFNSEVPQVENRNKYSKKPEDTERYEVKELLPPTPPLPQSLSGEETSASVQKSNYSPSPPVPHKNRNLAVFEVIDVTWTENSSSPAAPPSVPPPPPPPEEEGEEDGTPDEANAVNGEGDPTLSNSSPAPMGMKTKPLVSSPQSTKQEIRKMRSDFLGTNPHIDEELTIQPPPDLNELLRQEREAERKIKQKQASLKREQLFYDSDSSYSSAGLSSGRQKYTWEDRVKADEPKSEVDSLNDSVDTMEFHTKLAELEQEMEKHDRVMLQRVQGSSSQDKLSTFDHETSSDIPSTHLQYNGSIAPTVEAPPLPEPNNSTVPQTQNVQHVSNSENIQHLRQQELYSTSFYKHESNEYKSVDSSSYYSRQKNSQENTYSELPSVSREIKKVVGRDPLSKSLSDGAPPPPVPRKQSILALSAIPKPKLTENESWIMKRKTETTKKDYSKHWLIQEAEQRRLEQQEKITRPNQIPLNKQTNLQTTPGYQTHFQNIKSSFNSASYNQNQNIYSNTSVQNNANTSAGFNGPNSSPTRPSSDLPPNRFISNNEPVTNATTVSPTIAPNNNWMKQTKTYQPQQTTSPSSSNSKPLPDAIISSITQRVNNKFNNGNNRTPIYNSATCNAKDEEDYHDYMNTGSLNVGSSYNNNNNKTINSTSPVGSPTGTPGQHFSSHVPPAGQQGQVGEDQRLLSVSGKKKCSHCGEELGRGAAMIIESLRLFYHIPCFKCCVCGIQLGNGTSGADVRVRNHKLHCHNCYSNDEGMKFSKV